MDFNFITRFKLVAGILLMIMNAGVWINGLFINRERGMDIILTLPLLYAGALVILGWYKNSGEPKPSKSKRWKFMLSVLLINYLVLYLIYMVSDIIFWAAINFLSIPGILLPVLLGLFVTGFILSWKDELYAGALFIIWYLIVVYSQLRYEEILHRGPYLLIGITVFIHGILYIYYSARIKSRDSRTLLIKRE